MVNVLRPSKYYFPKDITIFDEGYEGRTFIITVYISIKNEAYKTWEITWIII
jgi:hypothetical protein